MTGAKRIFSVILFTSMVLSLLSCSLNVKKKEQNKEIDQIFDLFGLTARSYDKILRVARTVADLSGSEYITSDHIAEAIQYRTADI